ncbi:MAG: hypothetical protein ABMA64_17180, partial [Myxococcota bacterium]
MLTTLLSLPAFAQAWSSDPVPVVYADLADVFSGVQFDTGYWPSATDPIAIRFYLTPSGGVSTTLPGTSRLEWPELSHHVDGVAGGEVELDTDLEIGAEVSLDLLGIFSGVVPLVTRSVSFTDRVDVDDLLLPGSPNAPVQLGDDVGSIPPLEYAVAVIPGVDLVAGVNLLPTATAAVQGMALVSSVDDQELVQPTVDAWSAVAPPEDRPGELGLVTRWQGAVDAQLSIVLEPNIEVDTFLGSFSLLSFQIPVDLVGDLADRESAPVFAVHPLPVLALGEPTHEFGAVTVGAPVTWPLSLDNVGELVLVGVVGIEGGDGAFAVWPDGVTAVAGGDDGLSVTFDPPSAGPWSAELWLETNDPYQPVVRVGLSGTGVGVDGGVDVPDPVDGEPTKFCGCGSAAG